MKSIPTPQEAGLRAPEQGKQLPLELIEKLRVAAKDAELLVCCARIEVALDLNSDRAFKNGPKTFEGVVAFLAQCFRGRGACDTAGKALWERFEKKDEAFMRSGLPIEFVLQCVRVGAVRELYQAAQEGPDRLLDLSYQLRPDKPLADQPTRDPFLGSDGGLHWANARLGQVREIKRREAEALKREAASERETKKERALLEIGEGMTRVPGYQISPEHLALLREDFQNGLRRWKALFQGSEFDKAQSIARFFNRTESFPITYATYRALLDALTSSEPATRELYEAIAPEGKSPKFLEMLNPRSGWSYPVFVNEWKTYAEFASQASCNADGWWEQAIGRKKKT